MSKFAFKISREKIKCFLRGTETMSSYLGKKKEDAGFPPHFLISKSIPNLRFKSLKSK